MRISDKTWSRIHDFLLSVGSAGSPEDLGAALLRDIPALIPFENSGVLIEIDGLFQPKITASVNSDKKWNDLFNDYYHGVSLFPEFDRNIFFADNRLIRESHKSEYYNDFLLPQKIRYSAGIILSAHGRGPTHTLVLNRAGSERMFSDEELSVIQVLALHLSNYYRMLSLSEQYRKIPVMISELERANGLLSPRESEIVSLLVTRKKPAQISDELGISLLTVRKHISNIYEKLNVTDRQQLFQVIQRHFGVGG